MGKGLIFTLTSLAAVLLLVFGCGGDGGSGSGSGSGTGTVALDIADARPFIEGAEPDELWLVFEEVWVHQSGGWVPLDLPETPFEINLLAFSSGLKTEFVTPTLVPAGHITQIRFLIERAYMVYYGNPDPTEIDLGVPSGILRTDKQCDWWVEPGGALHYTVHFDLSQSIVETGVGEYKLKPVIHLFDNSPDEAAEICGRIAASSFVGEAPEDVTITVMWEIAPEEYETYTKVWLARESDTYPTEFCIFWLVPDESYTVQIDNGFRTFEESVPARKLEPGQSFQLNRGSISCSKGLKPRRPEETSKCVNIYRSDLLPNRHASDSKGLGGVGFGECRYRISSLPRFRIYGSSSATQRPGTEPSPWPAWRVTQALRLNVCLGHFCFV